MRRIVIFIAFGLSLLVGCSHYMIQPREVDCITSSKVMLIGVIEDAGSPSKETIIDSLVACYGNRFDIQVVNVKFADDLVAKHYDVLVLMDQVKAGMGMNNLLRDVLKNSDPKRTVVFLTSSNPNYHWDSEYIHITAATKKGIASNTFARLQKRIDKTLTTP